MWWSHFWAELIKDWASYSGPALSFVAGAGAVTCAIWLILDWTNGAVLSSLRARLKRAEDYKLALERAFRGRSPEDAAARLGQLEAHLASQPPRRLSEEQKQAIVAAACPPPAAPYLTVVHETSSPEADRFARDFVEAFSSAPGWNVVDEPYPKMPHAMARGIAVGLADPADPTPTERLVLLALQQAGLGYDLLPKTSNGANAELIVSAR